MSQRQALALVVLCLLSAAVLRLPALSDIPPGLHYDEAANGILAADIGLRGERPVFIPSYTGKEVAFFYLAGTLMRLIGDSVFVLRLAAALLGLLTVAATYWLGWELSGDRRLAVLAAALLAVSFWHVLFSRLGFRAISQPLFQALTVAALLRGLRRHAWTWIIIAGLFLGLSGYTYLAIRFFPIPLGLALLYFLFRSPRWRPVLLYLSIGLATVSPLLIYFIRRPEAFLVRAQQVMPGGDGWSIYAESYVKSLGMLFLAGDPYWRFNIPDKPLFGWFLGGLLLVGWLVALFRWPGRSDATGRLAQFLLLIWPFVMILPTALAVGEIVPSNLRAVGLLPFIFFLPALGLLALLDFIQVLERRADLRLPGPSATGQIVVATGLILVAAGVGTGRIYFGQWAERADLYYESDADLVAVAGFLDSLDLQGRPVYLAAQHYRHPTVAFLSSRYDDVRWLPGGEALVFPADGRAVYVFPHNSPPPAWSLSYLQRMTRHDGPAGPDGTPDFVVYEQTMSLPSAPKNPAAANFENIIRLNGYDIGADESGDSLPITLYWEVTRPADHSLVPFVHLEDNWRYRWGQVERDAYPAEQWQAGDTIVQRLEVPLRPGLPPGTYRLRIGLFDPANNRPVAVLDEEGRYAGSALIAGGLALEPTLSSGGPQRPPVSLDQPAGPGLTLLGYERGGSRVGAGASFWFSLWWQADTPLRGRSIRLELARPDNTGLILANVQPVHNTLPFTTWATPLFLIDHHQIKIPLTIPAGEYRLLMRLLTPIDETILKVDLGPLTIEETDRLFTPPPVTFPLAATLGGEIALLGYNLEPQSRGHARLTLVWQAVQDPSADYTVFVHVLDLEGTCCPWQQDRFPVQGEEPYPTSRWLPGEVVVDTYELQLPDEAPAGSYQLEIGLYLAENGRRLAVTMPEQSGQDAIFLPPLVVED